jgi:hypothetical protein
MQVEPRLGRQPQPGTTQESLEDQITIDRSGQRLHDKPARPGANPRSVAIDARHWLCARSNKDGKGRPTEALYAASPAKYLSPEAIGCR